MTAKAMITASVPSVNTSKRTREIPHVSWKLYPAPTAFSITSGNTATNDASRMKAVHRPPAIHKPGFPAGRRDGRGTTGWASRSVVTAGQVAMWESRVVDVPMDGTRTNEQERRRRLQP